VDGELRWGYQPAASLRDLLVVRDAVGWTLTARVTSADSYAVAQRPLTFVINHRGWQWPVLSLQIAESTLTAVLGPQM